MENKTIAIIQARLTSSRFPNKVIQKIGSYTLIEFLINRLKSSKEIDQIIVAIPDNTKNKLIKKYTKNTKLFFGNESDVLDRFYKAAKKFKANNVVRICGDCPFIDASIIDSMVRLLKKEKFDYVSNTIKPTFPDGLDVEVFKYSVLKEIWVRAKKKYDREHVTPYILKNKRFKKFNYKYEKDLSNLRLTIDEEIDLKLINIIYSHLKNKKNFGINEIRKLYDKDNKLFLMNSSINRNEGSNLGKGQKLWKRAKQIIPGGNMLLSKRSEMFLPNLWPSYFKTSKYNQVTDLDGNKYTDFIFSVGQNIMGYRNPIIEKKIIKSIKMGNMTTLNSFEEVQLAEKLLSMHPWFDMVRFARSGGEANAIAIRIARASTKKQNVAICGYHGWHDWYLATNLKNKNNLTNHLLPGLEPLGVHQKLRDTVHPFEYNDFKNLKSLVENKNIGIIKMEVSRNSDPKNNFLQKVRKLCNEKNIILIFDECTSGFRKCFGGLHKIFNVKPDMAMFGKALGNGHAITAVIGKRDIMEAAQKSFISSTFWTERTGSVAGIATLNEMERIKSWDVITKIGKKIKKNWEKLSKSHNLKISVSGLDALCSFSFKSINSNKYKTLITQEMLKKKYLASNLVYVSIAHDEKSVEDYFNRLDEIFRLIRKCENHELDIDSLIKTEPAHTTFRRLN
jgi:glutamate-1-semialdehyde 2,1-aminomutase